MNPLALTPLVHGFAGKQRHGMHIHIQRFHLTMSAFIPYHIHGRTSVSLCIAETRAVYAEPLEKPCEDTVLSARRWCFQRSDRTWSLFSASSLQRRPSSYVSTVYRAR
jgi:hypothetical protein